MRRNNRNAAVLVADSGSTKTDWMLLGETGRKSFQTQGLNPVLMPEEQIVGILQCELLPELPNEDCFEVFFYGAGVRPEFVGKMEQAFQQAFAAGSPFAAITPHSTLHTPHFTASDETFLQPYSEPHFSSPARTAAPRVARWRCRSARSACSPAGRFAAAGHPPLSALRR